MIKTQEFIGTSECQGWHITSFLHFQIMHHKAKSRFFPWILKVQTMRGLKRPLTLPVVYSIPIANRVTKVYIWCFSSYFCLAGNSAKSPSTTQPQAITASTEKISNSLNTQEPTGTVQSVDSEKSGSLAKPLHSSSFSVQKQASDPQDLQPAAGSSAAEQANLFLDSFEQGSPKVRLISLDSLWSWTRQVRINVIHLS